MQIIFQSINDTDTRLFDLSHLGLIAISGDDAIAFLQGQFTNDMRKLTRELSQLGSHCNSKGRMLAIFRVFQRDDVIYIQLPKENLSTLLTLLNKYKLRARIQINDSSAQLVAMGVTGEKAIELLHSSLVTDQSVSTTIPEQPNAVVHLHQFTLVRMAGTVPRIQVFGTPENIQTLKNKLINQGIYESDTDTWRLLEIRAGIPCLYQATADLFLPQMVNLDSLEGVSFAKGCYVGQEVIARLQHLGTLKRRMYRAEITTSIRPNPGDPLYSASSDSGQGAGKVVEVSPTGNDCYELLAVVEIVLVQNGIVQMGNADGPPLHFWLPI